MSILIKIAIRNVMLNRKKTILLGIVIFLSSLLLFLTDASMNGVYTQAQRGYVNLQSGHVAVEWESTRSMGDSSAGKFLMDSTFDSNKEEENKKAVKMLKDFILENEEEIRHVFYGLRKNALMDISNNDANSKQDNVILYGLTEENMEFILNSNTLSMYKGNMLSDEPNGICISKSKAEDNNFDIGDKVTIEVTARDYTQSIAELSVTGIYNNGAGYDNLYGFLSQKKMQQLLKYSDDEFDLCRIYLKDMENAKSFAKKLNQYYGTKDSVLLAEDYEEASVFYTSISKNLKFFFQIFTTFLLIMIGVGMQSTLRLNLFQRMKEFGTLRAIGYSKARCFHIVFLEVSILSFLFWILAFGVAEIIVTCININGIYVGTGAISYTLGGEYVFPKIKLLDVVKSFVIIIGFSLLSTFAPALRICYQRITDTLAKRQTKNLLGFILTRSINKNYKRKKGEKR